MAVGPQAAKLWPELVTAGVRLLLARTLRTPRGPSLLRSGGNRSMAKKNTRSSRNIKERHPGRGGQHLSESLDKLWQGYLNSGGLGGSVRRRGTVALMVRSSIILTTANSVGENLFVLYVVLVVQSDFSTQSW